MLLELQKTIEGLKESRQKKVNWTSPVVLNRRPENGRTECYYCKRVGHIARFCFDNPQSSQYKGNQRNTVQRPQQTNPHTGPHVNSLQEEAYYEELPHHQPHSSMQGDLPLNNLVFQKKS